VHSLFYQIEKATNQEHFLSESNNLNRICIGDRLLGTGAFGWAR